MSHDLALLHDGAPDDAPPLAPIDGLTMLQSRFVLCYVEHGDGNATRAALAAGYASTSAAAVGYRLLRHGAVQRAILAATAQAFAASAPIALRRMVTLADSARSQFVQQQAAADILDRAGFRPNAGSVSSQGGSVTITIDLG